MFKERLQREATRMLVEKEGRDVTMTVVSYEKKDGARTKNEEVFEDVRVALFSEMSYSERQSSDAREEMVDEWTGVMEEEDVDELGLKISSIDKAEIEDPDLGKFEILDITPVFMGSEVTGFGLKLKRLK